MCVCVVYSPLETSSEWLVVESVAPPEELQIDASKFIDFDIDEVRVCTVYYIAGCTLWSGKKIFMWKTTKSTLYYFDLPSDTPGF